MGATSLLERLGWTPKTAPRLPAERRSIFYDELLEHVDAVPKPLLANVSVNNALEVEEAPTVVARPNNTLCYVITSTMVLKLGLLLLHPTPLRSSLSLPLLLRPSNTTAVYSSPNFDLTLSEACFVAGAFVSAMRAHAVVETPFLCGRAVKSVSDVSVAPHVRAAATSLVYPAS